MLRHVAKHSKKPKTTKLIKLQWIASIWFQSGQKSQNYKSNQIPLNLHRFEVKTIKILRYVAKLQKWSNYNELHWFDVKTFKTFVLGRKTTKVIKLQWSASIWHQNNQKFRVTSQIIQNNAKLRKSSNYNELHRFDVKTIKTFELGRKTFKTTQNYKRNQITMNCIDLASERSKMLRYVAKHSKQRKTTKRIKFQWIPSIWCENDQKT